MSIIDEWTVYMTAVGQAPSTIQLHYKISNALLRHADVTSPTELTRMHCIAFLARPLKPWSKLTYWKALGSFSRYLIEFGHTDVDLLKGVPRPQTPDPVARPLTDEVVAQLLALKMSTRAHAYVRLALYCGLRVHEIARIQGQDFDFASGWLMVTGKGGRTAPVPIHPEIAKLADRMPEFGFWFPAPSNPSRPVQPTSVSLTIKAALAAIGSNATAHQLRDTAATRMQRQVKDIRITQSMLRHRSIRSTQKYTSVSDDSMHAAVLSLDWGAAA